MFCPRCGTEKGPFVKGFCMACYIHEHPLLEFPSRMEWDSCKNCAKVKVKGRWEEPLKETLGAWVKAQVKVKELRAPDIRVSFERHTQGNQMGIMEVRGALGEELVELHERIPVKVHSVLCDDCMKMSSEYHESILQVRFSSSDKNVRLRVKRLVERHLKDLQKKDSLAQAVGMVLKPTGFDVLIGSKRAGKETASFLSKKFSKKVLFSSTLVGITRTGKQKKRYTFLVRVD